MYCTICFCFVAAAAVVDDDDLALLLMLMLHDADDFAVVIDENENDDDIFAVAVDDDDAVVVVIDLDDVALTLTYLVCRVHFLPNQKDCWDFCAKFCANLLRSCSNLRLFSRNKGTKLLFFQAAKFCTYPFLFFLRQAAPGETSPRRRRETGPTSTQSTTRGT